MPSARALFTLVLIGVFSGLTYGEDWPGWRGPDHNGVSSELSGWNGEAWELHDGWYRSVEQRDPA